MFQHDNNVGILEKTCPYISASLGAISPTHGRSQHPLLGQAPLPGSPFFPPMMPPFYGRSGHHIPGMPGFPGATGQPVTQPLGATANTKAEPQVVNWVGVSFVKGPLMLLKNIVLLELFFFEAALKCLVKNLLDILWVKI